MNNCTETALRIVALLALGLWGAALPRDSAGQTAESMTTVGPRLEAGPVLLLPAEPVAEARLEFIPTADAIRKMEDRIRANPADHYSMVIAAQLYLREGRETGQHASLEKAEGWLRQALLVDPGSKPAHAWLVSALNSRHKFREALEVSESALRLAPGNELILSARGDAHLELGELDQADAIFQSLAKTVQTPGMLARLARVAELRGDPELAVRLVTRALEESARLEERPQTTAWYEYRLGTLCFDQGQLETAASHLQAGLQRNPDDPKMLVALARVRMASGELPAARKLYEQAVWKNSSPAAMAEYAGLLRKIGQPAEAQKWIDSADRLLEREFATTGRAHRRDRALFLLNHDRRIDEALRLARADFESRQDVFAHDTLAWALHKNGQTAEAMQLIRVALAPGTRDATLYYHAAEIARAGGESAQADQWLAQARAINPHALCLLSD
jgi:tetratricopeptide (TPR) repeat protein